jgi:hypothetical protein
VLASCHTVLEIWLVREAFPPPGDLHRFSLRVRIVLSSCKAMRQAFVVSVAFRPDTL